MDSPVSPRSLHGWKFTLVAGLSLLTTDALFAQSAGQSDVDALKAQMNQMQRQYEQRIEAMEGKMKALESNANSGSILNTRVLTDADGKEMPGKAAPMLAPKGHSNQATYLLHPPGAASESFAAEALRALPELSLVPSVSPTDLTFCREQGFLAHDELRGLLPLCHAAYEELAANPALSPHARFDVPEWLPLDT